MRIGIDAVHISRNRKGVGRVERNIVETLAKAADSHESTVVGPGADWAEGAKRGEGPSDARLDPPSALQAMAWRRGQLDGN